MLSGQMFKVDGTIIVNYHLPIKSSPQYILALPGGGQVSQRGLALLQASTIEPIGAVDVDGTAHVVNIVERERPAI